MSIDNWTLSILATFTATMSGLALQYYQIKDKKKTEKAEELRAQKNTELAAVRSSCASKVRQERTRRREAEKRALDYETRLRECLERRATS